MNQETEIEKLCKRIDMEGLSFHDLREMFAKKEITFQLFAEVTKRKFFL